MQAGTQISRICTITGNIDTLKPATQIGGSSTQAQRPGVTDCNGSGGWLARVPAVLGSPVMPSLRLGEVAGEFTNVAGADQVAYGGVTAWRHCPVIAGCAAAPDPPLRVLALEPLQFDILVVAGWVGVHGGRRLTGNAVGARPASPVMTSPECRRTVDGWPRCGRWRAAGIWNGPGHGLPPSRRDLRYPRALASRGPARGRPVRPPALVGRGAVPTASPPDGVPVRWHGLTAVRAAANRRARPGGGPGPRDETSDRRSDRGAGPVTVHRQAWAQPAA